MADSLRYDTRVNLSNKNNSHTLLVLLTGRDKKVLEVGPATGYVTQALVACGCRVTGIEIDPEAAEIGRLHCKRMIVGSVEEIDFDEAFANEKFDVVIYGDVLEHLLDPEGVLRKTARILAPGGCVVASLPNVAHGSIRLALLRGDFRYTDVGLLDRTHVRFFTRDTLAQLFEDTGYAITTWRRTTFPPFGTEQQLKEEEYPEYLVESLRDDPDAQTYQFVVQAVLRAGPSEHGAGIKSRSRSRAGDTVLPALLRFRDQFVAREAQIREQQTQLDGKSRRRADLETELTTAYQHIHNLNQTISAITGSIGRRLLKLPRALIRVLLPPRSPQRTLFRLLRRALGYRRRHGWRAFLAGVFRVWEWPRLWTAVSQTDGRSWDDQYQLWLRAHALTPARTEAIARKSAQLSYKPKVSIIMPVYNTKPSWLRAAIESVRGQLYEDWELCIADDGSKKNSTRSVLRDYEQQDRRIKVRYLEANSGISAASNQALAMASGEFIGMLDHDDELKPDALYEVIKLLNDDPDLDFIYSDEDRMKLNGRLVEPFFKPDWSPDLLMSINYVAHFSVFRKGIVDRVGGFRPAYDGSQDYDLVLRVTELTDKVAHIARPLYSWRKVPGPTSGEADAKGFARRAAGAALADALSRRGYTGDVLDGLVPARYRVRYDIIGNPKVAIIIPTRDRLDILGPCVESIRRKSSYRNYEILIVDNNSQEQETLDYLSSFDGRVVRDPHEFNFAKLMNLGAREAEGADTLLFLNNDTEVISAEWIEAMLEHAQRPEVGAVGARLLYPDGRIQHEGVIIGLAGSSAGNVDHGGYLGMGETIRDCSSVTGACMMVRSQAFRDLGGFDERIPVAFNDVDFCLRAREKGYLVVYTPYALLYHYESASRGKLHPAEDEQFFRDRWGNPGDYRDPYYNPNLDTRRPFTMRV